MAQHKKKPTGYQIEAVAKAHHKNEFLRKLKIFVNSCCNDSEPGLLLCKQLYPAFEAMSWYLSDLGNYLYWLNYELKIAENGKLGVNNIVQIHRIVPDMIISFQDPKVFYDGNHNLMIEYRIFETKAGYFRIDINKGVVVVRTFLFLTQSSTSEGQLLWKNTGLQKLDKKYLAIDKLSSFMSSDIGENESIRKIFNDSGCHSLLELYERYGSLCIKHPHQQTCKLMIDYLGDNLSTFPEEISDNEPQTPNQDQLSDNGCDSPDPEEALVLD